MVSPVQAKTSASRSDTKAPFLSPPIRPTRAQLEGLGATIWTYTVPQETLQEAAAQLPEATVETPAEPMAPETVAQPEATMAAEVEMSCRLPLQLQL